MKKIFIVLGIIAAFLTVTAFIIPEKTNDTPQPGGSCKTVGNCTVELLRVKDGYYAVHTLNRNSYPVTVSWKAYGYVSDRPGRILVGSGQIYSSPAKGSGNTPTGKAHFSTTATNVHLDEVNVSRCE